MGKQGHERKRETNKEYGRQGKYAKGNKQRANNHSNENDRN
ncbi:hypothetical protein [Bacillus shivajii]|nr:hypothetical protein [Bacillus shivajii]